MNQSSRYKLWTNCGTVILMVIYVFSILLPYSFYFEESITSESITKLDGDLYSPGSRAAKFTPILETDDNMSKHAYPRDLVVFNCTVKNGGNMVDDYEVESDIYLGWQIILYPDKFNRIPPFSDPSPISDRLKTLTIKVIVGDIYNATVGNYPLEIILRSKLCPSNYSSIMFNINVQLDHIIGLTAPISQDAYPGAQIIYDFQITNLGNGDDVYSIWAESSDWEWLAQLVDDTQETLPIEMGDTIVISVILYVSESVDAGQCQITTLCAQPQDSESAPITRAWVETSGKSILNIEIDDAPAHLPGDQDAEPMGYANFVFTIINRGNDLDNIVGSEGTFIVSKIPDAPVGWETWFDTSDIREGGLPKGLDADIGFMVKVPPSTPVGKYKFIVDVYTGEPLQYQDSIALQVNVVSIYKAEAEFKITEKSAHINENVSFSTSIYNIGNIQDTYRFALESVNADWTYIPSPSLKIDYGQNGSCEFYIEIPEGISAGPYEFILVIGSEGDQKNITFNRTYTIEVLRTLDFAFVTTNVTYDAMPSGETIVHIEVKNTGNSEITLSFSVYGEPWCLLDQETIFLSFRETKSFLLIFIPPRGTELKTYMFDVMAQITVGIEKMKSTTIFIRVVEFEFGTTDIYVNDKMGMSSYSVNVGENTKYNFGILNDGNQYFDANKFGVPLFVNVYLGDRIIFEINLTYLARGTYEYVDFQYIFHKAGQYNITVKIEGSLDNNSFNDVGMATINALAVANNDDNDDIKGEGKIRDADWVWTFVMVFLSIITVIIVIGLIKNKYDVNELRYDAKEDYMLDEGTTLLDDIDFGELLEEEEFEDQQEFQSSGGLYPPNSQQVPIQQGLLPTPLPPQSQMPPFPHPSSSLSNSQSYTRNLPKPPRPIPEIRASRTTPVISAPKTTPVTTVPRTAPVISAPKTAPVISAPKTTPVIKIQKSEISTPGPTEKKTDEILNIDNLLAELQSD